MVRRGPVANAPDVRLARIVTLLALTSGCTTDASRELGPYPPQSPAADATMPATFDCGKGLLGETICKTATQYCATSTFAGALCEDFPLDAGCDAPSCACVPLDGSGFAGNCTCIQLAEGPVYAGPCGL